MMQSENMLISSRVNRVGRVDSESRGQARTRTSWTRDDENTSGTIVGHTLVSNDMAHDAQVEDFVDKTQEQSSSELDPNDSSTPSAVDAITNSNGVRQSRSTTLINGLVYRDRKKYDSNGNNVNRIDYNSISRYSASRFSLIMKHLETKDWKIVGETPTSGEDVAFVVSPHHHLVDDAWRSVRAFATSKLLKAGREKLTDVEKNNIVPKYKRKIAFLVVVANSKATLKKVMAAERTRLGFIGLEGDRGGLVLEGTPLCPSPQPIRFCEADPNPGPNPINIIGGSSPMITNPVVKVQNLTDAGDSTGSQRENGLHAELDTHNSLPSQSNVSLKRKIGAMPTDRVTRGRREPSFTMDHQNEG